MIKNLKTKFPPVYFLLFLLSVAFLTVSCKQECTETGKHIYYRPIYKTTEEIRNGLKTNEIPQQIDKPGRLYFKDGYIFINEVGKGIHVVDNNDPKTPVNLGFITIPGNYDLAAKGNYMYVDSYIDMIVLDISDPSSVKFVNRVEGVFSTYSTWASKFNAESQTLIVEYEEVAEEYVLNCDEEEVYFAYDDLARFGDKAEIALSSGDASVGVGVGGSMARFTIYQNFLYTVDNYDMRLFDLSNATIPEASDIISLGWGIETIYPKGNKLFIGANNGMHIYDNANPQSPEWLSTYSHINSCDPVVVRDNYAFVTLRSGNECLGFTNQLEIVDISDLRNPTLYKTYPMENPHGLGINGDCLFITEGSHGLKFFDANDIDNIQLVEKITRRHSLDVIALDELLLVIGEGGFRQYEYNCTTKEWSFLSAIEVTSL